MIWGLVCVAVGLVGLLAWMWWDEVRLDWQRADTARWHRANVERLIEDNPVSAWAPGAEEALARRATNQPVPLNVRRRQL